MPLPTTPYKLLWKNPSDLGRWHELRAIEYHSMIRTWTFQDILTGEKKLLFLESLEISPPVHGNTYHAPTMIKLCMEQVTAHRRSQYWNYEG